MKGESIEEQRQTMWVFCCGMRRAGSTLQYQLTAEIVESQGLGKALGWVGPEQLRQIQANHVGEEGLLVVKCHGYIEGATELFSKGEAKAIYVYRDIRDVVVSMVSKSTQSFWWVISNGFVEGVLKEYDKWNSVNDILVSRYETMVVDLRQELLKIADYLGANLDECCVDSLSQMFAIDKQRERIEGFDYDKNGVQHGPSVYDPTSLLHRNHIHSGKSGQWNTALSRVQVGLIEDLAYEWLVDKGYRISENWLTRKAGVMRYSLHRVSRVSRFAGHQVKRFMGL